MDGLDIGWRTALLFSLIAPVLLVSVIIVVRAAERPAFLWLAALLATWCWHSVPYIIGFAGAYTAFPWLTLAPFNMELWFGPLLYLHAYTLAHGAIAKRQWRWLVPGIVQFGYYVACFVLLGDAEAKFEFSESIHMRYIAPVETATGIGLALTGMLLAWRETRRYRDWLGGAHAAADAFDPAWLRRFVAGTLIVVAAWLVFDLWSAAVGGLGYQAYYWMYVAIGIVFLLLALDALTYIDVVFPKIAAPEPPADRRGSPALGIAEIEFRLRGAGWHRDANLSLKSLASHLGTNEKYLSKAINDEAGVNFNRFINMIRIEDVCERLRKPGVDQPLLRIAIDSGFASKATFNRVFRDIKGQTPGQWRREARKSLKS